MNKELKKEYETMIKDKYGSKKFYCGLNIEKLMKLELALQGNEKYQEDPEIKSFFLTLAKEKVIPHTSKSGNIGSMDMFCDIIQGHFGPDSVIHKEAIKQIAVRTQNVVSDRAIQNRINYMIAKDIIAPVGNNEFIVVNQKEMDF